MPSSLTEAGATVTEAVIASSSAMVPVAAPAVAETATVRGAARPAVTVRTTVSLPSNAASVVGSIDTVALVEPAGIVTSCVVMVA